MTPRIARCALALTFVLPSIAARSETILYDLELNSVGAFCNPSNAISCVRYNGDSENYQHGFRLRVEADFDEQVGSLVPLRFPNFFIPDVQRFGELVEIDLPTPVIGTWDTATGELIVDVDPVEFPTVVLGGTSLETFELTTEELPGDLFCAETIPQMVGAPIVGTIEVPGEVVLVGRACVQGPGLNETFFVVLAGTLQYLPEPDADALAWAAVLALGIAAGRRKRGATLGHPPQRRR